MSTQYDLKNRDDSEKLARFINNYLTDYGQNARVEMFGRTPKLLVYNDNFEAHATSLKSSLNTCGLRAVEAPQHSRDLSEETVFHVYGIDYRRFR